MNDCTMHNENATNLCTGSFQEVNKKHLKCTLNAYFSFAFKCILSGPSLTPLQTDLNNTKEKGINKNEKAHNMHITHKSILNSRMTRAFMTI